MQDKTYQEQIANHNGRVDIDFWRNPEGVSIPDDELNFLLVPDAVDNVKAYCELLASDDEQVATEGAPIVTGDQPRTAGTQGVGSACPAQITEI